MQVIINISEELFRHLFNNSTYSNNFTYEGLGLLYEYLSSLEEEGKPKTLNLPELCTEYSEETLKDFCFRHDLSTFYNEPVDVDDDGETVYISHASNNLQLKERIREYFSESNYFLMGFTDDTVLFY